MTVCRRSPEARPVLYRAGRVVVAALAMLLMDTLPARAELVLCNLPSGQNVTMTRDACRDQVGLVIGIVGTAPEAPAASRRLAPIGAGSGVLLNDQGDVLTNFHVIEHCAGVQVHTEQAAWVGAQVVARDAVQDLALLRSGLTGRRSATLRSGPPVRLDEDVMATGFPMSGVRGLDPMSATFGAVRSLAGLYGHGHLLSVTARLRPGNSGGPILDMGGNVIGVGTRIYSPNTGSSGRTAGSEVFGVVVRSEAIIPFLADHAAQFAQGTFDRALGPAAVAESAREFTVRVVCLGER